MLTFSKYRYPMSPSSMASVRTIYDSPTYIPPRSYKALSRYSRRFRIEDTKFNVNYHETYKKKLIPESTSDKYITITENLKNRIDLVSANAYGTSLYWWIIAIGNDLINPWDLPVGKVLRIPAITSLYMEGSVLS